MFDITYSPATIRGYFKKLGDEGYLVQEHISSGRIPTTNALEEYWQQRLNFELSNIDYNKMINLAHKLGLTVFVKQHTTDTLHRVLNVDNIYMILEFYKTSPLDNSKFALTTTDDSYAVTIKYNSAFYKFLVDMVGRTFDDILDISLQVGARHLYTQLSGYLQNNIFEIINTKKFLHLAVKYDLGEKELNFFLQGDIMVKLEQGVYLDELLPKGQIGICHNTKANGTDLKILVVGSLTKDLEYFYKGIAI
jgi:heat-inducible transcriptional repressor